MTPLHEQPQAINEPPLGTENKHGWVYIGEGMWQPGPRAHTEMQEFRKKDNGNIRRELIETYHRIMAEEEKAKIDSPGRPA